MAPFKTFHHRALKIVYFGPGTSGKTESLRFIHSCIHKELQTPLLTLNTETGRTLYFDFLQVPMGLIGSAKTRLTLYTVPGQIFYHEARLEILRGTDAIIFVADCLPTAMQSNIESMQQLEMYLAKEYDNRGLRRPPVILQLNKKDQINALSLTEMQAQLNPKQYPTFYTSAITGEGILETLRKAARLILKSEKTLDRTADI